jgi:hypothetical protein
MVAGRKAERPVFGVDLRDSKRDAVRGEKVSVRNPVGHEMKTQTRNGKLPRNGVVPTRRDLIAAQERALKKVRKLTGREGFETLVQAGIYTPDGKLAPRYGG